MSTTNTKTVFALYALLVVFIAGIYAFSITLPVESRPFWLGEGGVVETLSALGYFVCFGLMLFWGGSKYLRDYHYFALLVLIFGLRELDFDKRFTTMGIFKSKFYSSSDVPMFEKAIGFIVIAILAYIVYKIISKHLKQLITGTFSLNPVCIGAMIAVVLLFVSKSLDGLARKMLDFNITISKEMSEQTTMLEEILELAIPLAIIIACYAYLKKPVS